MRFNGTVREGLKTGSYKGSSLGSRKEGREIKYECDYYGLGDGRFKGRHKGGENDSYKKGGDIR